MKNGKLLEAAEAENFDVLVTGDLSLKYQQNLTLSAINWPVIERIVTAVMLPRRARFFGWSAVLFPGVEPNPNLRIRVSAPS